MKTNSRLRRGAALVDYGLLAGLVAIGAIGVVASSGEKVARAYCTANNGMAQITGAEPQAECLDSVDPGVALTDGERFVNYPVTRQPDFANVLFANSVVGDQIILVPSSPSDAAEYWLDTTIASRDAYDPSRTISSCYSIGGGVEPICAAPGSNSAILVPADAAEIGYAVTVITDTDMPWGNDVGISIPAGATTPLQNWAVDVAREDGPAVVSNFSVSFGPQTFSAADTGWTYADWAVIGGKFNQTLDFRLTAVSGGEYRRRRACYLPTADEAPVCGVIAGSTSTAQVAVAPGSYALGYMVELPAKGAGTDWVVEEDAVVRQAATTLTSERIQITRPNEPANAGTMSAAFMSPWRFAQTDSGWTEAEFISLSSDRNVALSMEVYRENNHTFNRRACYKTSPGGTPVCGNPQDVGVASISVPVDAVEVGYMIELPAQAVGNDLSISNTLRLRYETTYLFNGSVETIRPNEPYDQGGIATSFSTPYTFMQADSSWTNGEFVALTGIRNTDMVLSIGRVGTGYLGRRACYRVVSGGETICGASQTTNAAQVTVPVDAVEIGYAIQLPSPGAGPDWTSDITVAYFGPAGSVTSSTVTLIRPNEPYQFGSSEAFAATWTFGQSDTDWTKGQFVSLTGTRNADIYLSLRNVGGLSYTRRACYTTVVGGTPICGGDTSSRSAAVVTIPPNAVEAGYMAKLPPTYVGDDWTSTEDLNLYGRDGTSLQRLNVTLVRPNEPYDRGGTSSNFSTDYVFASSATGWTEGEFIGLTGSRNVNLTMNMSKIWGANFNRRVCYKTTVGGVPTCGANGTGSISISVPIDAVEVGYMVELPPTTYTYSAQESIRLYHSNYTLQDVTSNLSR